MREPKFPSIFPLSPFIRRKVGGDIFIIFTNRACILQNNVYGIQIGPKYYLTNP
jgi:hypothetical protein